MDGEPVDDLFVDRRQPYFVLIEPHHEVATAMPVMFDRPFGVSLLSKIPAEVIDALKRTREIWLV